jgi:hypothetical protein
MDEAAGRGHHSAGCQKAELQVGCVRRYLEPGRGSRRTGERANGNGLCVVWKRQMKVAG